MSLDSTTRLAAAAPVRRRSFRRSVLRGVGLILPPLLTIVILVWVWNTVQFYMLSPLEDWAQRALVWQLADIREVPGSDESPRLIDGRDYVQLASREYVPREVVASLRRHLPNQQLPLTGKGVYEAYVRERYMQPSIVLPVFGLGFLLVLYLIGKSLTAGLGEIIDRSVHRLPLVRSIYGGIKKITDFIFIESQVHYKRVVAIEYPRRGVWSIGLVTGEGVAEINAAMGKPCVTVAIPGSPMPFTGLAVTVPQDETYDLKLSIDQALQFVISCGVAVPQSPPSLWSAGSGGAAGPAIQSEPSGQSPGLGAPDQTLLD